MPGSTSYPTIKLHDNKTAPAPKEHGAVGECYTGTITIGAEASNVIRATIQLQDISGSDLATITPVLAYLSSSSTGDGVTGTGPSTESAIGVDGSLTALVTKKVYLLTSEADGDIDIDITESGAATWYLVLIMPDGRLVISDAITFV